VWWRWEELNLRHGAYETPALPLSYTAVIGKGARLRVRILPYRPAPCHVSLDGHKASLRFYLSVGALRRER
jgi:hypothetical protein